MVIMAAVYWCLDKNRAYRIGFGFFAASLTVNALKITLRIPRPWVRDSAFMPVEGSKAASTGYSFPSGHTQAACSVYGSLSAGAKHKFLHIIYITLICAVSFSRLYLGVHTPADVACALAVGGLFLLATEAIFKKNPKDSLLSIGLAVFSLAGCIYGLILYYKGVIVLDYLKDLLTVSGSGCGFALCFYLERKYINFDERRGNTFFQLLKLAIGLGVTVLLKSSLKWLFGEFVLGNFIRYFVLLVWIMGGYPWVLRGVEGRRGNV